jgi:hypothetical protein
MTTVLIVSKTQMKNGVCVGGINEDTNELIRIHNDRGGNLPSNAPFEIGDRWSMAVSPAWNARPVPHTEDKQTTPFSKIGNVGVQGIKNYVCKNSAFLRVAKGSIANAFEGMLHFEGTKNFVNRQNIPSYSTEFWISDKNLVHSISFDKHYYYYDNIRIKFVGFQSIVDIIPAGTIIRLSLANWWDDGSGEERCYLQLSGWYL